MVKSRSPDKISLIIRSVFSTGECMMSCVLKVLFDRNRFCNPAGPAPIFVSDLKQSAREDPDHGTSFRSDPVLFTSFLFGTLTSPQIVKVSRFQMHKTTSLIIPQLYL